MMASEKRFILVLAGTQSGKTSSAPWWMFREICRKGPGDYIVAAPTFRLLDMKCVPEYKRLFEERLQIGTMRQHPTPLFTLSPRGEEVCFGSVQRDRTRILFGHAQDPDSLESATAKAAHLDEAGQKKFKLGSWEAIQRRLSIHQGRVLISTTPYCLGWLKNELHDRALAGDPDVELIQFESIMNPAFPKAEFERMRAIMPAWKFNMMYRGRFERPAGMIYDVFDRGTHTMPRFSIPVQWMRFCGLDFGGVNTAGVFLAKEPTSNRHILYRTYRAGGRTAAEHATALQLGEPSLAKTTGGSASEGQWRQEFRAAGLPVDRPPTSEVEVGIDRVYAMIKNHPSLDGTPEPNGEKDEVGNPVLIRHAPTAPWLEIFDDLAEILDDLESYSRELDDNDDPTEKIEDKEAYHLLDATRYVCSSINDRRRKPDWSKAKPFVPRV